MVYMTKWIDVPTIWMNWKTESVYCNSWFAFDVMVAMLEVTLTKEYYRVSPKKLDTVWFHVT
jgi:hypothetical protein